MQEQKTQGTHEYYLVPYASDRRSEKQNTYEKVYNLTEGEARIMNYNYSLNGVHQRLVRVDSHIKNNVE